MNHFNSLPFSAQSSDDQHYIEQEPHTISAYGVLPEYESKGVITRPPKARRSSNASTASTSSAKTYMIPWSIRVRQLFPHAKALHAISG
ncbi:hypothetical protein V5O48_002403 [Marasmius crinis-equi]|uniref:Uncharacterized protein n=1 Tax=Marasmius crinis-equi TaxID=585013 RepID=A0ABR3FWX6_9AGAR